MNSTPPRYNSALPIIKPGYSGNPLKDDKFTNEDEDVAAGFGKVLRWQLSRNPQREEKKRDTFRLPVTENRTFSQTAEDVIVWLGHATFFIRINGISLLTDPVFGSLPLIHRHSELPCLPSDITGLRYLLISHGHRDHLDKPSIRQVLAANPDIEVLAPLKMEKLLRSFGTISRYQEAGWYQQFKTDSGVDVYFLPAKHWHRRGMNDFNEILWGSFLIKTSQHSVYFGGDSAYGAHFRRIHALTGDIDVCILPVGAYKPPFMMQGSHMNPAEAVQAFQDLGGKTFIPMHYGTFDLSDEPMGEPPRMLQQIEQAGKINGKLRMLAVGENYRF